MASVRRGRLQSVGAGVVRRVFQHPARSARTIGKEVDEELDFHIRARTEELIALGHTADEAYRLAMRSFGNVQEARREIAHIDQNNERVRRRRDLMSELRQDIDYALRKLRGAPAFALTAILTLALGVGANTAIFSVVNGVLLRPLPFPREEQLYQVWSLNPSGNLNEAAVSALDLEDWRSQRRAIADIGGFWYAAGGSGIDLTGEGEPQRLSAVFVEPGFFSTLGVQPQQGRLPRDDEMKRGGRDRVAILSNAFWQRQYGASASVVGKSLTLGGESYEVLGVMPRTFRYPADEVDIYIPMSTIPDHAIPRIRPVRILDVVARARDGVTAEQVQSELKTIAARLAAQYPDDNGSWTGVTIKPLRDAITGNVRVGLLVLLGAVGFVLLLTCVNVASLLLARATAREREIAVRLALGASRGRVVRQLMTESVVLSLVAGIAGLLVAYGGLRALISLSAGQLPRGTEIAMDTATLLYALAISVVTGLLFGLVPAIRASATELQHTLRGGGRGVASGGATRLRYGLVISEVALSMMLVVGGGLMTRSFLTLLNVDPGFRPENLIVLNFTLSTERHENYALIYQQMLETVRRVPGVVAAGSIKDAPLRGPGERTGFMPPGMTLKPGQEPPTVPLLHISEGFFHAIGTKIIDGREFEPSDREDAPLVLVVNETFARQWFPGERAVGKTLDAGENRKATIIGVVADIRQRSMSEPALPTAYIHVMQNGRVRMNLIVRTSGPPLAMAGALRDAVHSVDRLQPITSIFTYDDAMRDALARPRLLTVLLGVFGLIGLTLGALGLYGVLAYLVSQRQREIGVRLALGARPDSVLRMIVGRGLALTGAGIVIGAAFALALGRYLSSVLYGVAPSDPLTMLLVTLVLLTAAVLASWIPARRAARVDPAITLREE